MSQPKNQRVDDRHEAVDIGTARRREWQRELSRAITTVPELLSAVGLADDAPDIAHSQFPLRVPRGFVARMRRGDRHDPLLQQALPVAAEADDVPGFAADPVGDLASMLSPGLLQKYHGRALLITTGACAIHCRYCFRRNFPYGESSTTPAHLDAAVARIAADPTISEVILSGGDPLSLSDDRLRSLLSRLAEIDHVERIRLHTRYPVVLPERIDDAFCDVIAMSPRPLVVVIHANHANEIDSGVAAALAALGQHAALVLNQTVLLKGVNDSAPDLATLSTRLADCGVSPYYLHQLDPVAGAAHFTVSDERARHIVGELTRMLPGYLVPKLVREISGEPSKRNLGSR
ncbi:MAG: EF-P beta-lysylation protein EpmB [Gammaproteobacteria bacterium]